MYEHVERIRRIRNELQKFKALSHSRFGHYFYSNLYGRAPRGPRGVKKSEFFLTDKTVDNYTFVPHCDGKK
jgi:hypothetical protein